MSFSGKVVIVTGASCGIGAATAVKFSKEGADLVLVGRNETKLNNIEEQCAQIGKQPLVIKADVSKDDDAVNIIKKTIEKFGRLDVLVNNAGFIKSGTLLDGNTLAMYDAMVGTNLRAVIHLTEIATPHLIKSKGNIVNVSSVAGQITTFNDFLPYSITKAGVDHFTRGVAKELAAYGVRVNSVNPGPVDTGFFNAAGYREEPMNFNVMQGLMPLNRVTDVNEVADIIIYLASDKAASMTGGLFLLDNGLSVKGQ